MGKIRFWEGDTPEDGKEKQDKSPVMNLPAHMLGVVIDLFR